MSIIPAALDICSKHVLNHFFDLSCNSNGITGACKFWITVLNEANSVTMFSVF